MRQIAGGSAADHEQRNRVLAMSNTQEVNKSAETQRRLDLYLVFADVRMGEDCPVFTEHQPHGPLPVTEPVAYAFLKALYELEGGISPQDVKAYKAVLNAQATDACPRPFTAAADKKHEPELAALRHKRGIGLKQARVDRIDGLSFQQMEGHLRLLHKHVYDDDQYERNTASPPLGAELEKLELERFHEIELQFLQFFATGIVPANWDEQGLVEWFVQHMLVQFGGRASTVLGLQTGHVLLEPTYDQAMLKGIFSQQSGGRDLFAALDAVGWDVDTTNWCEEAVAWLHAARDGTHGRHLPVHLWGTTHFTERKVGSSSNGVHRDALDIRLEPLSSLSRSTPIVMLAYQEFYGRVPKGGSRRAIRAMWSSVDTSAGSPVDCTPWSRADRTTFALIPDTYAFARPYKSFRTRGYQRTKWTTAEVIEQSDLREGFGCCMGPGTLLRCIMEPFARAGHHDNVLQTRSFRLQALRQNVAADMLAGGNGEAGTQTASFAADWATQQGSMCNAATHYQQYQLSEIGQGLAQQFYQRAGERLTDEHDVRFADRKLFDYQSDMQKRRQPPISALAAAMLCSKSFYAKNFGAHSGIRSASMTLPAAASLPRIATVLTCGWRGNSEVAA
jgi:hypothetical protein